MSQKVPEGWNSGQFDAFITLQRGFDLPVQDRTPGDYLVIASNGAVGTHSEHRIPGPAVVTGRSGTIGNVFIEPAGCWPLNTTLYVKDFHGNDPEYVYWFLQHFDLGRFSTGTGVPTLNRNIVHREAIAFPPLLEQRRIAEVLSCVNEAIVATQAVIQQARKVKQGVLNRLLTKGIGHTRFKQTEIGEIPEAWEVRTLKDTGTWSSGGTPSKNQAEYWGGSIPWISPKDMKQSHLADAEDHVTEIGAANGTRLIPPSTVLVVVRGMILAKVIPVAIVTKSSTFNQDIKALQCNMGFCPEFVRCWLECRMNDLMNLIDTATHGTKRLPHPSLLNFPIPQPARGEQEEIAEKIRSLEIQCEANQKLLSAYQGTKAALMTDLLTGRKRVSADTLSSAL